MAQDYSSSALRHFEDAERLAAELFNFDRHADEAPHKAWHVLADSNYAEFNPPGRQEQLRQEVFARTFGNLVDGLVKMLPERAAP